MILGVVLAGGRSSRFGSNKANAILDGRALIEHARSALAPYVDRTLLVGGERGDIPDLPHPDMGPLGGIAGALDYAADHGFASVITIACDMPRLPGGLLAALAARVASYCPEAPVLGHWPTAVGAQLLAHIEAFPGWSVRRWAQTIDAWPISSEQPIPNVNTPADLAAL
jgi:molybdopterin-guanine dinucleotide biosynthesis protein A